MYQLPILFSLISLASSIWSYVFLLLVSVYCYINFVGTPPVAALIASNGGVIETMYSFSTDEIILYNYKEQGVA
jgi:hypothetical protein